MNTSPGFRSHRSSISSQNIGQEMMTFEEAKSVFERGLMIEKLSILDAQDVKESGDLDNMSWNLKSLSDSVSMLENDLFDVLIVAKGTETFPSIKLKNGVLNRNNK